MNKFIGHGRLTKDPEVRYTQSSKAVASFTIAMDRPHKQDAQQQADFLPCVAWDKLAEVIGNNLTKGREIIVEGRIQTRSYDAQDGSKRYVTECVLFNMEFCGSKPQGQQAANPPSGAQAFGKNVSADDVPF